MTSVRVTLELDLVETKPETIEILKSFDFIETKNHRNLIFLTKYYSVDNVNHGTNYILSLIVELNLNPISLNIKKIVTDCTFNCRAANTNQMRPDLINCS